MRLLILATAVALLAGRAAAAAAPVHAHMEIVSQFVAEEYNPDAETQDMRVTRRTQGREIWRSQLRVEHIHPTRWPEIKRNFSTTTLDFHDLVWASNARERAPNALGATGGRPMPVWPVTCIQEEATWTLLDVNRKSATLPSKWVLVKTAERTSGGKADLNAGFFVEMMRSEPLPPGDEPDSAPLVAGTDNEPERAALTPFTYHLSAAISGFMVRSDISGVERVLDTDTGQWSESQLAPQTGGVAFPVFARRTRPATAHNGVSVSTLTRPGLRASLVETLIANPENLTAPIKQTGTLTEIEYASEVAGAPMVRRRRTMTRLSIELQAQDLPPAVPLAGELPPAMPLSTDPPALR
ncbi:MAG: hypothetical protein WC809_12365 [Sinimarinibacterium sp.]|jgi:hypothetical protein